MRELVSNAPIRVSTVDAPRGLETGMKWNHKVTIASITVSNIPDEILEKIRALSTIERGTFTEYEEHLHRRKYLAKSAQLEIWKALLGTWKDNRTAEEIIKDIYSHRTGGRDIQL